MAPPTSAPPTSLVPAPESMWSYAVSLHTASATIAFTRVQPASACASKPATKAKAATGKSMARMGVLLLVRGAGPPAT